MIYETHCLKCEKKWTQSHRMKDKHENCPACGSDKVESVIENGSVRFSQSMDVAWETENNGLGRYFSQLETSATCTRSKENFFRSRNDAIEAAKRRGFEIIAK